MGGKQLTVVILGIVIIFLIIYDIFALTFFGIDSTISVVLNEWSFQAHPLFVFSFGMVSIGWITLNRLYKCK